MGTRPPRWLNCPRKSVIISDKFIAFKTFLDGKFDSQVPMENMFQYPMLKSYVSSNKKELGMVLDLTNTGRFYDRKIVETDGVRYCKLQCRGHGEAPNIDQTKIFLRICDNFFQKKPNKIIGVHCTHGFNGTGFLIVSYLCETEEWSVDAAVQYFAKCRPPGIYKQMYLQELFQRYGNVNDTPKAPELPEWCFDEEDQNVSDDEGGGVERDDEAGGNEGRQPKKMKRRPYNENAKFCENIPLETVSARGAERIQDICDEMLQWNRGNFGGSQPVSMDRKNVDLIQQKPYRVTWKADGTRYTMLIVKEGEVYFLDRDNSVFLSDKFFFPRRKQPEEHIFDTLVDGELVMDKDEKGKLHPRYLIYDIIKFEGQDVGHTDLDRRLLCIDKEIIKPRAMGVQSGRVDKSSEPFGIRKKAFHAVEGAQKLMDEIMPKMPHETDGLIFQPLLDPYVPGQCPFVLKWKPHELNSVDFLLNIITVKREGCLAERMGALFVQGYDQPFSQIKVTAELKHYDKRIIECTWDKNQWKFLRLREDKSFPNAFKTATSVCESIKKPVTKDFLLDYIKRFGFRRPLGQH